MSWTDEEIDKLFQKEAVKQPVEYNDAYWKEFEALLPVSRKGDFLWFLTSGLFVALLLVTPFVGVLNEGRSAEIMAMENSASNGGEKAPNNNVVKDELLNIGEGYTSNNSSESNSNGALQEQVAIDPVNNLTENISGNWSDSQVQNIRKAESKVEGTFVRSSMIAKINSDASELVSKSTENVKDETADIERAANASSPSETLPQVGFLTTGNGETIDDQTAVVSSVEEERNVRGDVNTLDISKAEVLAQKEIPTTLQSISYDLSLPARTTFFIEANAGVSQSLITPSDDFSHSFGAGVGAQFRKGRIVFTTGVNVLWAHHKDIHLNRQAKVYGFGSTVVQCHLNYSELYTLEANLNVGYQLGRHNINVGVRPSYVVGSKVKFTQSDFSTGDNRTVYGFTDGINRWGIKPSVGYGFDINNHLTLGLNVSTQLLESVNEEFINGVNNKLPFDGQIYLRKTFRLRK